VIYIVEHVYGDPETEPAWHEWYSAYLVKLLAVPGIRSTQRFRAPGKPSRYLAMYSVDSADVFESDAYRRMGGGGSQSARFQPAYRQWIRNLFDGADRAPPVRADQTLLVWDRARREFDGSLAARATWLESAGLHRTTPWRALVVLDAAEAGSVAPAQGSRAYRPLTPYTA